MSSRAKRGGPQAAGRTAISVGAEEPPALDVGALLQQERVRQVQAGLEASQAAYDELATEHYRLQDQRWHEEREAFNVAALFRREVLTKNEQLVGLQQEAVRSTQELQEAAAAAAEREAQLQALFDEERQQLAGQVAALQAQLDGLAELQRLKEGKEAEMQRLREENARIVEQSGEKVRALQRRLYEFGHGDGGDGEEPGSEATAGGGDDGGLCLEADLHRMLAHSRKAANEMKLYGQEAEELQREMEGLEAERADLLRDVRMKEEMEQQYAKRGTLQAREIRSAHTKITSLEKGLVQMAADFEQEKAALGQQLRAQLAEAVTEQNSLRRLLRVRTKELRQVRQLAQEVLLQRSDVEAFLVSSIQHVRAEMAATGVAAASLAAAPGQQQPQAHAAEWAAIAAETSISAVGSGSTRVPAGSTLFGRSPSSLGLPASRAASAAAASLAGAGQLPSRSRSSLSAAGSDAGGGTSAAVTGTGDGIAGGAPLSGSTGGNTGGGTGGPVDIKDLSWEDRERILRLLFSKINKAAQRPVMPPAARVQVKSESQAEAPAPTMLRGLATEAGPAGLA